MLVLKKEPKVPDSGEKKKEVDGRFRRKDRLKRSADFSRVYSAKTAIHHPLLATDIPNLIVTPHNAWASRTARQSAVDQLAEVISAFADGGSLNQVN